MGSFEVARTEAGPDFAVPPDRGIRLVGLASFEDGIEDFASEGFCKDRDGGFIGDSDGAGAALGAGTDDEEGSGTAVVGLTALIGALRCFVPKGAGGSFAGL